MKSSPKSLIVAFKNNLLSRKCDRTSSIVANVSTSAKRMFSNDGKVYLFDHDTSVKKIGISNNDSESTKYRAKISDNFSIGITHTYHSYSSLILILILIILIIIFIIFILNH